MIREDQCECEKYCCLCQTTLDDIRLCQDGLMYCDACRKACDYKTRAKSALDVVELDHHRFLVLAKYPRIASEISPTVA
jgi:hypothetical protein